MDPQDFRPAAVRYIKLGAGGRWARDAFEQGVIPFSDGQMPHDFAAACAASGDWKAAREHYAAGGGQAVGHRLRELRDFYGLGDDTLWITITGGRLWWAFAEGPVRAVKSPAADGYDRYRQTRDGWHGESLGGRPLLSRNLSSALTRTAAFRQTLCRVEQEDYLLRQIRDEPSPLHAQAAALKRQMVDNALDMIRLLHWQEFETLVDLIFTRGGWRRTSLLGLTMPDVDLVLDQPVTGEIAWVQVKTWTRQAELDDYIGRFALDGSCDHFFFVCHSPAGTLTLPKQPGYHLWTGDDIAAKAIDVGLFDWLMERIR